MVDNRKDDDQTKSFIQLTAGTKLSHYTIISKIGAGGMGEVYLAEDTQLNRKVALKFLTTYHSDDEVSRARLFREAKAEAKLDHPSIVPVYEVGEFRDRLFFAMAFIEGKSLREIISTGKHSIEDSIEYTIQICKGLYDAHCSGVIHRDIKPENIIIDKNNQPRIFDFGLATIIGSDKITKTGSTMGTANYMSPEQIKGIDVDNRSDIFSLMIVFYELLTGVNPFKKENNSATMYAILNEPPKSLIHYNRNISYNLEKLILKGLQKNINDRYSSFSEIINDLVKIDSLKAITNEKKLKRIAVIPFENLGSEEDEYFCDGITDELISSLTKLKELGVVSRTSIIEYKKTQKKIREIGAELGVDYILEGTIRWDKSAPVSRVRISTQLIRVRDDIHLWAEQYEAVLDDIFKLQVEIAQKVIRYLNLHLVDNFDEPLNINTEAYDYYLQAKQHYNSKHSDSKSAFKLVETLLNKAIKIQPNFSQAYAWLGHTLILKYHLYFDRSEETLERGKTALLKARELNPDMIEIYRFWGRYEASITNNFKESLRNYNIALNIEPNNPHIYCDIANTYQRIGKWEEAFENLEKAIGLNPKETFFQVELARAHIFCHQYVKADSILDCVINTNPEYARAYVERSLLHLYWKGDYEIANEYIYSALEVSRRWPALSFVEIIINCYAHNFERALRLLTNPDDVHIRPSFKEIEFFILKGDVYRYKGDERESIKNYAAAEVYIKQKLAEIKDDPHLSIDYARVLACQGNKKESLSQINIVFNSNKYLDDAVESVLLLRSIVNTYIVLGEYEKALDKIEYLLSVPSIMSIATLKNYPDYMPIHNHPRFISLIKK